MASEPAERVSTPFAGDGEIRALCRAIDWSRTSLGPVERWPQSLLIAVRVCMDARSPMAVWAGPEHVLIYNHGYPPVLGKGRHPWALGRPGREVWPNIWDHLGPELARVLEGESVSHEDQRFILSRDGREEETFFTYSLTPIQEADGRIVGAFNVFMETTARIRSLTEREARYLTVFENASDAIIVVDPSPGGRVLSANPAACALFGCSRDELTQLRSALILGGDGEATVGSAVARSYPRKDGRTFRGELRTTFYADAAGHRRAVAIIRDVTERERSDAELRRALAEAEEGRRTLQALMDHVPEGITIADAEGVTIRMVSRYGQEVLGAPHNLPAEEVTRRWKVFQPDGDTPMAFDELPLVRAIRRGEVVRDAEVVQVASDGARLHLLCNAAPIRDALGQIKGGVVAWKDITDRRRAEDALREANTRLLEADKAKNDFLAVLSHELRNPLAPIRNSLYVLERATPGGEQANRARQVIDRQTQHMTRLVEDLLDVTRISRGKITLQREVVDLAALARRTAEDHRELFARAGIELQVESTDQPIWVDGDPTRLAQVIGNLLANSAKFTPSGGHTSLALAAASGRAVIRVRDDGSGIAPEVLGQLFEPFVQAAQALERSRGGLGLGLALVKGFVEMHGGTVEARSDGEGRGTELVVTLPLREPARDERAASPDSPAHPDATRVLIIEDNVDAAHSLREALELGAHQVVTAYDGAQGLELVRRLRPEVVVCDLGLPGVDGFGVARAIRSDADPSVRSALLVALSGYAQQEDVDKARAAGFDVHMPKPPDLDVLGRILGDANKRRA